MNQFKFHCPDCHQRVRPDNHGKFKCRHQGTMIQKGNYSAADTYLLDEVDVVIEEAAEG